jgi:hypothetical protein
MTCTADHKEPANWLDTSMPGGKIRTVCKECGRFIGYRDAATDKQDRNLGSKKR